MVEPQAEAVECKVSQPNTAEIAGSVSKLHTTPAGVAGVNTDVLELVEIIYA